MRKVLTFGVFDYFHLGHLRLFKNCKKYGDYLIVGIQNENYILKFKPNAKILYSTDERVEMIQALEIVDEVVTYDYVGPEILSKIDFDVLALGEDHRGERFEAMEEWCKKNNKDVVRLKRTQGISSTDIKKRLEGKLQ